MPERRISDDHSHHSAGSGTDLPADKWNAIRRILRDLPESARVLECGAGRGHYTAAFLHDGHTVTAVDLSDKFLRQCRNRATRLGLDDELQVLAGDFTSVARSLRNEFDLVTFINVLHHYPDSAAIREALEAASARLRLGGSILIFEMNGASPLWYPLLRIRGKEAWATEKGIRMMTKSNLGTILKQTAGITWSHGYRFVVPGRIIRAARPLDRLDRLLCEIPGVRLCALYVWFVGRKAAIEHT